VKSTAVPKSLAKFSQMIESIESERTPVSRHQDRATVTVMKFAHIGFGVKDLSRSKDFYKRIFEVLGLPLIDESGQSVRFGADGRALFYIHTREAPPGPFHVAFEVDTREAVSEFHEAALAAGGRDNGAPGIRKHYSPTYYAAFVLDPDGHNIEAVCRV
jgi:catechol 2,3-dioxygenase-like lactoylglutathione lyase family enzyme